MGLKDEADNALRKLRVWERLEILEKAVFGKVFETGSISNPRNLSFQMKEIVDEIKDLKEDNKDLKEDIHNLQSIKEKYDKVKRENEELKKENEELRKKTKKIEIKNNELENQLQDKSTALVEFKNQTENLTSEIEKLNEQIIKLNEEEVIAKGQIDDLRKTKEKQNDEIIFLTEWKKKAENQILSLEEIKRNLHKELTERTEELSDAKTNIRHINDCLRDTAIKLNETEKSRENITKELKAEQIKNKALEQEKESLSKDYSQTKIELNDTRKSFQKEKEVNEAYSKRFGDWDKDTQIYQDLMKSLYPCTSLDRMIQIYGMNKELQGKDVDSVIKFVGLLGNQTTFLPIFYEFLEKSKQQSRKFLTEEEMAFIKALNEYYYTFGLNFDFLQIPEKNSRFDKNCMSDMFNRGKPFRTVEGVYVPAIMRDATTYLKMALVKGN